MHAQRGNKTDHDAVYRLLQRRLDRQAVGFPATMSGADIRFLKFMFTPDEARVALSLSYKPAGQNAIIADMAGTFTADAVVLLLESSFRKGAIGRKVKDGVTQWYAMPLVIGIFEMQDGEPSREFLDAQAAYSRTLEYGKSFLSVKPSQMRTIPINKSVTVEHHIATYDEVRTLIASSKGPFVALKCICRESQAMGGKPCTKTSRLETCLGMGDMAAMTLRRGHGREVSADEALALLGKNEDDGLVLQPANARNAEFVCSCCGCCCGMLRFQKRLPHPIDFWSSNFYACVDPARCSRCGVCVSRCQVDAIAMNGTGGAAKINLSRCIGCGLCVPTCPKKAVALLKKAAETIPPENEEAMFDAIRTNRKGRLGELAMMVKLMLGMRQ